MKCINKKSQRSILTGGLILLLLGSAILLRNLEVIEAINIGKFWPLALVAVGIGIIAEPWNTNEILVGVGILAVGIAFQLKNLGIMDMSFSDIVPFGIIFAGVAVILQGLKHSKTSNGESDVV